MNETAAMEQFPLEDKLIQIEVKAGSEGSLRSLHLFMDEASHDIAVRFYMGRHSVSISTTPRGKKFADFDR